MSSPSSCRDYKNMAIHQKLEISGYLIIPIVYKLNSPIQVWSMTHHNCRKNNVFWKWIWGHSLRPWTGLLAYCKFHEYEEIVYVLTPPSGWKMQAHSIKTRSMKGTKSHRTLPELSPKNNVGLYKPGEPPPYKKRANNTKYVPNSEAPCDASFPLPNCIPELRLYICATPLSFTVFLLSSPLTNMIASHFKMSNSHLNKVPRDLNELLPIWSLPQVIFLRTVHELF